MLQGIGQSSATIEGGLIGAFGWIARIMTGPLATAVATLAVAALGLTILQGRLSVKAGGRVAIGCFILFGAPFIAKELMPSASQGSFVQTVFAASSQQMPSMPDTPKPNLDPYAGASVPTP